MMSLNRIYRNGWRPWHLVATLVLVAFAITVGLSAWTDVFYRAWRDEEFSHIFLVPIIAAWLVWTRASRFQRLKPSHQWVGTATVAFGWLLFSFGDTYMFESGWYLGAILMVVGAVLSVGGIELVLRFAPAFVVLLFMIPLPGTLRPLVAAPMQTATAAVVEWLFMMLGLSMVTRTGNLLIINGEEVGIAEACNGLRMVFALILVTYGFVFSAPLKAYVRVILLLASPILAIVCNVIRLIPTLWAYGYMSHDFADTLHAGAGWAMLFVALGLLISLLKLFEWMELPVMTLGRVNR